MVAPEYLSIDFGGGGHDVESPDRSIQLGGVVRGIGTRQLGTAEQSRATARRIPAGRGGCLTS